MKILTLQVFLLFFSEKDIKQLKCPTFCIRTSKNACSVEFPEYWKFNTTSVFITFFHEKTTLWMFWPHDVCKHNVPKTSIMLTVYEESNETLVVLTFSDLGPSSNAKTHFNILEFIGRRANMYPYPCRPTGVVVHVRRTPIAGVGPGRGAGTGPGEGAQRVGRCVATAKSEPGEQ